MSFHPVKDTELGGGYRLIERLGAGGYGEVWRATAPGGLGKAVKIVYGDTTSPQAVQELRALDRIKEVRHPFLLSLERIDVLDGQLLIVMELAEGSLAGRYRECRKAGLPGIPRGELLSHLRDAASALDHMAQTHGLQHLDVKPENLLLVGNRIKVADFGLVRGLGATRVTGLGVTPIYATPEAFDGRVSRSSDQYSLAIVYQEMLTGVRPFPGSTLMQLAAQHISAPPELAPLPAGDRPVIARALAKAADNRFGSCGEMVEALLAACAPAGGGASDPPTPRDSYTRTHVSTAPRPEDEPAGHPAGPGRSGPAASLASLPDCGDNVLRETVIPAVARLAATPPRDSSERPTAPGAGIRPTLILGVGGLAGKVLCRWKERFGCKHPDPALAAVYRCLLVDTDPEALRHARQGRPRGALDVAETLPVPLHAPDHYRQRVRALLRWLDRRWLYGIPRSLLTEGIRPLGRLAFVDNAAEILARLRDALRAVTDPAALAAAARAAGREVRDAAPRVFVVASVTGGTGGGMLVSLACGLRQALADLGLPHNGVCGLLLYATDLDPTRREMARVNACATLREVGHLARPGVSYPGDPDAGLNPLAAGEGLFEETYLVRLGDDLDRDEADTAADRVGDYLAFDASPWGGTMLDRLRAETRSAAGEPAAVRTFGLSRLGPAGADPADPAANRLCLRLITAWLSDDGNAEAVAVRLEAERRVGELGLEEGSLAGAVQAALAAVTAGRPEALIAQLLAKSTEPAGGLAPSALTAIDAAFAPDPAAAPAAGTPLALALHRAMEDHGARLGGGLVGWLLRLVDTPGKRFKAAEHSAAFVQRRIAALQRAARARLERVSAQRLELRQQLAARLSSPANGVLRRARPAPRPRPTADLIPYCQLRLREAAEGNAVALLNLLAGRVEAFREGLVACGSRLQSLAGQLRKAAGESPPAGDKSAQPAAEDRWLAGLVPALDQSLTGHALPGGAGLWSVLSGHEDPFEPGSGRSRVLAEQFAEEFLSLAGDVIRGAGDAPYSAVRFFREYGDAGAARSALLAVARDASPGLSVDGCPGLGVVAVPEGAAGAELARLLTEVLPEAPRILATPDDDVVLCYETLRCPLPAVGRALLGVEDVPEELVSQVLSRLDVPWSAPAAAEPAEAG
jgi:serine/threonine protein kinase